MIARHVGVDRLVVGDAGADGVGEADIALPPGRDQAGDAEQAVRTEHGRVQEVVADPSVDRVHRPQPGGCAHPDPLIFDQQVCPFHERDAHFAGKEDVLEVGRVVDSGREQDHLRVAHPFRRDFVHGVAEPAPVVVDGAQPHAFDQVGEVAQHQVPVLDHVGDAGWRPRVVLEHAEGAVLVAHHVDAADMDVGAEADREALHLLTVIGVAVDQRGRDDAVADDAATHCRYRRGRG